MPLTIDSSQQVSATLGPEYVRAATLAGVIGLAIVALFMLLSYRLPGLVADLALVMYAAVVFALFKLLGVTTTLAAIAGFILSIGMAVDANILMIERMREELHAGKTVGGAAGGLARCAVLAARAGHAPLTPWPADFATRSGVLSKSLHPFGVKRRPTVLSEHQVGPIGGSPATGELRPPGQGRRRGVR